MDPHLGGPEVVLVARNVAGWICLLLFLDSYVLSRDLELSMFSGSAFGAVGACFPGMG